jgi:hypothetical protein
MVDPAELEARSGAERATSHVLGPLAGMAVEVTTDPGLTLADEFGRDAPAVPGRQAPAAGDGHQHAAPGIDHDPDAPRVRRPAQGVVEGTAGQGGPNGFLGERAHPAIVTDTNRRRYGPPPERVAAVTATAIVIVT